MDDYFLDSGDQVRCFFEEEAFDAAGKLRVDKALAINKIGHAMHDRDPSSAPSPRVRRFASWRPDLG